MTNYQQHLDKLATDEAKKPKKIGFASAASIAMKLSSVKGPKEFKLDPTRKSSVKAEQKGQFNALKELARKAEEEKKQRK